MKSLVRLTPCILTCCPSFDRQYRQPIKLGCRNKHLFCNRIESATDSCTPTSSSSDTCRITAGMSVVSQAAPSAQSNRSVDRTAQHSTDISACIPSQFPNCVTMYYSQGAVHPSTTTLMQGNTHALTLLPRQHLSLCSEMHHWMAYRTITSKHHPRVRVQLFMCLFIVGQLLTRPLLSLSLSVLLLVQMSLWPRHPHTALDLTSSATSTHQCHHSHHHTCHSLISGAVHDPHYFHPYICPSSSILLFFDQHTGSPPSQLIVNTWRHVLSAAMHGAGCFDLIGRLHESCLRARAEVIGTTNSNEGWTHVLTKSGVAGTFKHTCHTLDALSSCHHYYSVSAQRRSAWWHYDEGRVLHASCPECGTSVSSQVGFIFSWPSPALLVSLVRSTNGTLILMNALIYAGSAVHSTRQ
jgi:hypothetical protein